MGEYATDKEAKLEQEGVAHKVSSMLPYIKITEDIQSDGACQMRGNRISVKTLDLIQPFARIRAQLDAIAGVHFAKEAVAV